ncbi:MAG: efflux RND transporter periplasmic adaptor subunit [Gemmatimonadota bacterium]
MRVSALLTAMAGALLLGCGGDNPPDVRVTSVAASDMSVIADTVRVNLPVSIPGQVYVEHDAVLVARTAGIIDSVFTEMGSRVNQGQLLAQLENRDQQIALSRARVLADNSERILTRFRALAQSGHAAAADSEQARFETEQAHLSLQKAERDLELTRVTAPFSGLITSRTARTSRMVQPGDSLFRLTALAPLLVSVRIPEAVATAVRPGSRAQAIGLDGSAVTVQVLRISPIVDAASGTREAVLMINGAGRLRPGASVMVQMGAQPRTVIAIPARSVSEGGYVTVWENGRATTRAVQLGTELPNNMIEVVSGLDQGERIASTPP